MKRETADAYVEDFPIHEESSALAKNAVGGRGKVAAPEGGGGFADYAVVSLHCLRVYLEKSYRESLDLLSEMSQVLGEIGLKAADLPHHSTLVKWFDRIKTPLWRVLLRPLAQLHDPSGHAATNATFFDCENASKHYCWRTNSGFRRSKQPLSSTQRATRFWTFTVRPRNATTHSSAGDKSYDGWNYAKNSAKNA
ncbi:ISH9-type transposase [Natrialba asiatica DSM 12278]|uniref:ISH9-type transposase n=1 Tax=Natrialba asiatica (strain ATCC 700177 / DSM 12278 / JCM 9576 / FERM P-10747 / NBRC 102637 / 172P1) TaxID=29540 RepID=M0B220_NATA1|nr:ISH9-type transposase [Natrialba asiatica DSM 12278]